MCGALRTPQKRRGGCNIPDRIGKPKSINPISHICSKNDVQSIDYEEEF